MGRLYIAGNLLADLEDVALDLIPTLGNTMIIMVMKIVPIFRYNFWKMLHWKYYNHNGNENCTDFSHLVRKMYLFFQHNS